MRRRTVFAAPFIVVAGCGGPRYTNPPPPRPIPVEECRAIVAGSSCQRVRDANGNRDASYCSIEAENPTCGVQGYSCEATEANTYVWKPVTPTAECPTPTEPPPASEPSE